MPILLHHFADFDAIMPFCCCYFIEVFFILKRKNSKTKHNIVLDIFLLCQHDYNNIVSAQKVVAFMENNKETDYEHILKDENIMITKRTR